MMMRLTLLHFTSGLSNPFFSQAVDLSLSFFLSLGRFDPMGKRAAVSAENLQKLKNMQMALRAKLEAEAAAKEAAAPAPATATRATAPAEPPTPVPAAEMPPPQAQESQEGKGRARTYSSW